jgi:ATP-dependent Lhr-like helicase
MSRVLDQFDPLVRAWFSEQVGVPTHAQRLAWPAIAAGEHVLLTAPTGSGKTLAAFLWALHQLATGVWEPGATRVVYISPLRALNNDIRRNLLGPLEALRARFEAAGQPWPGIRVLTRSSDTTGSDRQRMVRRPPEILVTTPESLNLLVSSAGGRRMLSGCAQVILDEIHAVVGSKRGTHLITAVDRLALLSGEVQRVALSATVRPVDAVASFVGGYTYRGTGDEAVYTPRAVSVLQADDPRRMQLELRTPDMTRPVPDAREPSKVYWRRLADEILPEVRAHRSTLVFANNRRTTEKLTRFLNEGAGEGQGSEIAWAHHGSLSRELRLAVEARLKAGQLDAIVATNSLELGIDVGALDQVVLVQTPPTIASAVQRLGRAGHQVGAVSRGVLFPLPGRDIIDGAVVCRAAVEGDLEPVSIPRAPLDVLAQIIVAMTGQRAWPIDDLFAFVRSSAPYRELSRKHFDLVIDMLAGRYGHARLRELQPRVVLDGIQGTVTARPGALRVVYLSGGTIPDRGYYKLRHADTKARIGELDEEFVWERSLGDTFTLGTQTWRVHRITHNDVEVVPVGPDVPPSIIPFWRAEARNRTFHLAERIGLFLERADTRLDDPAFLRELERQHHLSLPAARDLVDLLSRQRSRTGASLPHRHHLLVEHFSDPLNSSGSKQVILHTCWGGRINQPLALAIAAAWRRRHDARLQVFHDDHGVLLLLPDAFGTEELLSLLDLGTVEDLLRDSLGDTGLFGAHFRENAARALLLPRVNLKRRMPLWVLRQRSKKLLEHIARHPDFPIVLETWRQLLQDEMDLPGLAERLEELRAGEIVLSECVTPSASPFCEGLTWRATNKYMYDDDTPELASGGARLRGDLLRELVQSPGLRPTVPEAVVAGLVGRLQRTAPGYAPRDASELVEHVKERLLIPREEWARLLEAMERDLDEDPDVEPGELLSRAAERLAWLDLGPGAGGVCALERLPFLVAALGLDLERALADPLAPESPLSEASMVVARRLVAQAGDPSELPDGAGEATLDTLLLQWLQLSGPIEPPLLAASFGLDQAQLEAALEEPLGQAELVLGPLLRERDTELVCDAQNLEILLRMARAAARPAFEPLPAASLPGFLAAHQGLAPPAGEVEGLQRALEQLFGFPARARAWEEWILPSRLQPYHSAWLEELMQDSDLMWLGCGERRVTFCFPDELELFHQPVLPDPPSPLAPVLDAGGVFDLGQAREATGLGSAALTQGLWQAVWDGRVSNSTITVLRRGIQQGFDPSAAAPPARHAARSSFGRWKASQPFGGQWQVLPAAVPPPADPIEAMERDKDRVRQVLERYGVVFRALLERELPSLRWGPLFRALRLMELSGELVGGLFFHGVPGPQFASHAALRALREPLPEGAIWWHNAADPASPCGLGLPDLGLPHRRASTWLAWRGPQLALIARANGRKLSFGLPPDHPDLPACFGLFRLLVDRRFRPVSHLEIQQIDDQAPLDSPYAEPLLRWGFRREYRSLVLRGRL